MKSKHEQFCKERLYLNNVSPRTIEWHKQSLKWLGVEQPTEDELKAVVLKMREAGLKASSVNCRLRSINAYLHWAGSSAPKCGAGCSHLRVQRLKEPKLVLTVFSKADIQRFATWKAKGVYEQRLQTLVLMLADIGARITELLTLKWQDVDLENLLVKLTGKGDKQRIIPFSIEMRKRLYRLQQNSKHELVFPTRDGRQWKRCNVYRDVKALCGQLGLKCNPRLLHSFRHSAATHYLKSGGSVALLQQVLGHESITTTMRYAHLATEDLSKIHERVSLLG
jgi:integrase/recombinase XerD